MNRNVELCEDPAFFSPWHKLFYACVVRSWWVLLCAALAYLFFAYGMHKQNLASREMTQRLELLEQEKQRALEEREELLLQVNSQTDPAYIELILMSKLGVVPEGQVKVYFQEE